MPGFRYARVTRPTLTLWTAGRFEMVWVDGSLLVHLCECGVRLHHLALGARDVESLADFYRRAFDLVEQARHYRAEGTLRSVWLDLGGSLLMIEASQADDRPVEGIGKGLFLIAFEVSVAERDRMEARLVALGGALETRGRFTSYARDPEGNRVAFSHYPTEPEPDAEGR